MNKYFKLFLGLSLVLGVVSSCGVSTSPSIDSNSSISSDSSDKVSSTPVDIEGKVDELTFFSVNDVHGALTEKEDRGDKYEPGISKLDYAIKHDEDWNENSVLLSCGDMFQGSALSNLSNGFATLDCMNEMGFEAMCSGNHEFDWGLAKYEALAKKANFPFLGINTFYKGTDNILSFTKPSTIINRGETKIGIVGSIYSTAAGSISSNQIKDIEFRYEATMVNDEAKRLKEEEKCDIVCLITHQGEGASVNGSLESSYVDLAFGGHTHRLYEDFSKAPYFVTGYNNGRSYQKITLKLNKETGNYESVKAKSSIEILGEKKNLQTVPAIDKVFEKYDAEIGPILSQKIGEAKDKFVKQQLGVLACHSLLDYARNNGVNAVAAFHNMRGIRIEKLEKGDITMANIYQMSPFDNEVRIIKVPGSELILPSNFQGNYRYKDPTILLEPDTLYDVVVFDFILDRAGFDLYKDSAYMIDGNVKLVRDCIIDYVKANSPLDPKDYIR